MSKDQFRVVPAFPLLVRVRRPIITENVQSLVDTIGSRTGHEMARPVVVYFRPRVPVELDAIKTLRANCKAWREHGSKVALLGPYTFVDQYRAKEIVLEMKREGSESELFDPDEVTATALLTSDDHIRSREVEQLLAMARDLSQSQSHHLPVLIDLSRAQLGKSARAKLEHGVEQLVSEELSVEALLPLRTMVRSNSDVPVVTSTESENYEALSLVYQ